MAKRGREAKYTDERVARICDALKQGMTDEQAAGMGGITYNTFWRWCNEKSDFRDAVKKAKAQYEDWLMNGILEDARNSLTTLIKGVEYEEVKTEYENDSFGNPRIKKQSRTTKKILPNPTAVIFALCNRDPEHWQNRINNELSGKIETETKSEVSLANIPDDLLAQVIDAIHGKE